MIDSSLTALDAGLHLAKYLEDAGIPYALGGALAYGIWAVPRTTMDVDINIFVPVVRLDEVLRVLESAGVELDRETATREAADGGQFVGYLKAVTVDVFVPSISFSWEALRSRVRINTEGQEVYYLSAEALCVFKLLFFRGKDLVDLERLIGARGSQLDVDYVRRSIVEIMGDDDIRVSKWDELVAEHRR